MTARPTPSSLLSFAFLLAMLAGSATPAAAAEPVRYILDTDIASDCDDAAAVAMVNAAADDGKLEVLAMMVSTGGPWGAPALSAINTWYGRGAVPIGTLKDPKFWVGGGPDKPSGPMNYESYNRTLAETFQPPLKSGNDAPDARTLYRRILAAQPDGSVVIQTLGPLSNIALLMETPADEISPLTGMELIRKKVRVLIVTGGRNPAGTSSNFSKEDAEKFTRPVIENYPGRMEFVGNDVGGKIETGWRADDNSSADNPARAAYKKFLASDETKKRHSSDQAGILYAVLGRGDLFELVETGHQTCDKDGNTRWVDESAEGKQHAYVRKLAGQDQNIAKAIESLMHQAPRGAR